MGAYTTDPIFHATSTAKKERLLGASEAVVVVLTAKMMAAARNWAPIWTSSGNDWFLSIECLRRFRVDFGPSVLQQPSPSVQNAVDGLLALDTRPVKDIFLDPTSGKAATCRVYLHLMEILRQMGIPAWFDRNHRFTLLVLLLGDQEKKLRASVLDGDRS